VDYYTENSPRGEYVLILEGAAAPAEEAPSLETCLQMVQDLRAQGQSLKDAVRQVSKASGLPRNTLYDAALAQQK
jgi:16S rRNA (cytidine1402-2'-O)-methyltransferase